MSEVIVITSGKGVLEKPPPWQISGPDWLPWEKGLQL